VTVDSVTFNAARVLWQTNVAADSVVECRQGSEYVELTKSSDLVTSHEIPLAGLQPSTDYICRVKSTDNAGKTSTSSDQNFTTLIASQSQEAQSSQSFRWWPILIGIVVILLLLLLWLYIKKRKGKDSKD
jgi:hypothetical protein